MKFPTILLPLLLPVTLALPTSTAKNTVPPITPSQIQDLFNDFFSVLNSAASFTEAELHSLEAAQLQAATALNAALVRGIEFKIDELGQPIAALLSSANIVATGIVGNAEEVVEEEISELVFAEKRFMGVLNGVLGRVLGLVL